jgi:bifunctional non-homologous end joining protein LigD
VRLSNPNRVLYPDQGVTKRALAEYYADIADRILPQLAERPLSLLRCPQGYRSTCFFQKHPGPALSARIPRVNIAEGSTDEYLYVRELPDLIALVQAGTLELHVWGSRIHDLEHPDMLVMDLDPGPDVAWTEVLRMAGALRERLAQLGLESFVRTTGGKGLHIVTPLEPRLDWDGVKAFARGVALAQARDEPRKATAQMAKAKRRGRIFIDYLRNGRGSTAIASYSTRARDCASVAVPVGWDELGPELRGDRFNIESLPRRLSVLSADPWADFDAARRPLTRDMLRAVGADEDGR